MKETNAIFINNTFQKGNFKQLHLNFNKTIVSNTVILTSKLPSLLIVDFDAFDPHVMVNQPVMHIKCMTFETEITFLYVFNYNLLMLLSLHLHLSAWNMWFKFCRVWVLHSPFPCDHPTETETQMKPKWRTNLLLYTGIFYLNHIWRCTDETKPWIPGCCLVNSTSEFTLWSPLVWEWASENQHSGVWNSQLELRLLFHSHVHVS